MNNSFASTRLAAPRRHSQNTPRRRFAPVMRMTFPLLTSIAFAAAVCLWLAGCASDGLKSYQRGNYYQACEEAVNKLRGNPNNADARTALASAYPLAQAAAQRDIDALASANDLASHERAIESCERMNRIATDILHCPPALALIPNPANYTAARNNAAATAARMAYDAGVQASAAGTLEKSREALDYFTRAARYSPGYRDVQARLAQALYDATLRVVVTRPQLPLKYQLDGDFFHTRLLAGVAGKTGKNLVRFYTPEEAAAENMINPHQIIDLDFLEYSIGNTREIINTVELSRTITPAAATNTGATTTGTTSGTKRANNTTAASTTVKAKYTTTRLEVQSEGVLILRIVDAATGRVWRQKNYPGKYVWVSESASFNGDERALDDAQLALANKRPQPPPPAQDMFMNFANPLYNEVTRYIISCYSTP